jgi:hypothetical protein
MNEKNFISAPHIRLLGLVYEFRDIFRCRKLNDIHCTPEVDGSFTRGLDGLFQINQRAAEPQSDICD